MPSQSHRRRRIPSWIVGGFFGAVVPGAAIATLFLLQHVDVGSGGGLLLFPVFVLAIMEVPAVRLADALELPIKNGDIAQVLYPLNALGYSVVVLFWFMIGILSGLCFDWSRSGVDKGCE